MSAVDPQARIAAIREMLQQQIGEAESSVRARQQYASSDREASDEEEREAAEMATRMSGRPVPARSEAERATSAAIQDRIVAKTVRRLGLLRACLDRLDEADELDASFNLRWKADMRAIERWRAERPHEREFRQPDHADLCVFLLDALASAQAAPPSPCVWTRDPVLGMWVAGCDKRKRVTAPPPSWWEKCPGCGHPLALPEVPHV